MSEKYLRGCVGQNKACYNDITMGITLTYIRLEKVSITKTINYLKILLTKSNNRNTINTY